MARSAKVCGELRRIADIVGSRPVMGHWPAMQSERDRQILMAAANIIESLDRELCVVAELGNQLIYAQGKPAEQSK